MISTISSLHNIKAAYNGPADTYFYITGSYGVVTASPFAGFPQRLAYVYSILPNGGIYLAVGRFENGAPHGTQREQRPALYKDKELW